MEVRWEGRQAISAVVPAAHVSAIRDYLPIAFKWSRRPLSIYVHMEGETSCRSKYVPMLEMAVREFDRNIPGRFAVATSPSDPDIVIDVSSVRRETLLTPRRIRPMTLKYLDIVEPIGGHGRAIYYEPSSLSIVFGHVQDATTCSTVERNTHGDLLHDHLLSYMAYFMRPRSLDEGADRRPARLDFGGNVRLQIGVVGATNLLFAKLTDSLTRR